MAADASGFSGPPTERLNCVVITRLMGGIGNQLFQYGAGRMLSEKHGVELALDTSLLEQVFENVTPRKYSLTPFSIRERIATAAEIEQVTLRSPGVSSALRRVGSKFGPPSGRREFFEKSMRFDPTFHSLGSDVYLGGYFQSEKYFLPIRPILQREIKLKGEMSAGALEVARKIRSEPAAVSIHMRRGDYATNPVAAGHHGVLPPDYFYGAIGKILEQVSNPHFFIFSDEPEWAAATLKIDHPFSLVSGAGKSDAEDLVLIAACRHHIISNSSFSWWGAWLSDDDSKIVVAPRKWFADPNAESRDIVPPRWLRV
jgi:hypothetical protein